jgi:hypothetical protein
MKAMHRGEELPFKHMGRKLPFKQDDFRTKELES